MAEIEKDLKELIVNQASQIFARYGFMKTTMNDIAAAVKKGKSTLYHYFPSKESVFQAILDKEYYLFQAEMAHAIAQEDTPQKKLYVYILTRMLTIQKLSNFYATIKDEYLENFHFIETIRKRHDDEEKKAIKDILALGLSQQTFAIDDLDTTALSIFVVMKGFEVHWIKETEPAKNKNMLDNIMDIIFYGITKRH